MGVSKLSTSATVKSSVAGGISKTGGAIKSVKSVWLVLPMITLFIFSNSMSTANAGVHENSNESSNKEYLSSNDTVQDFEQFSPSLLLVEDETEAASGDEKVDASGLSQKEKEKVLSTFSATSQDFDEKGYYSMRYDFTTKGEGLVTDFDPPLSKTKNRIRWSRGYEGTFDTVEDAIIIADRGIWLHKAKWLKDVEITVSYLPMSPGRKGDIVAAVYNYSKSGRFLASNAGRQCLKLKGMKRSGKAYPKKSSLDFKAERDSVFGMKIKDDRFQATRSGAVTVESGALAKAAKKVKSGRVGLVWRGNVNGFIKSIEIKGKLDPQWVKKSLSKR